MASKKITVEVYNRSISISNIQEEVIKLKSLIEEVLDHLYIITQ
jgi:hypothetical protein